MSSAQIIESLVRHSVDLAGEISPVFADRMDAGNKLADLFKKMNCKNPVLMTIPSGGVPVAMQIGERLGLPVHLTFAAKVRFSQDNRFGIGAVSSSGEVILNQEMLQDLPLAEAMLEQGIENARLVMRGKIKELAGVTFPIPDLKGKTVILAEDGIATGYTVLAAVKRLESSQPDSIIIAAPVISDAAIHNIELYGLEYVCLVRQRNSAFLVDNYYHSFPQISVEEVISMLAGSNQISTEVIYEAVGN